MRAQVVARQTNVVHFVATLGGGGLRINGLAGQEAQEDYSREGERLGANVFYAPTDNGWVAGVKRGGNEPHLWLVGYVSSRFVKVDCRNQEYGKQEY